MKRPVVFVVFLLLVACHKQENVKPAAISQSNVSTAGDRSRSRMLHVSYADAVERVGSGVVTIRAARRVQVAAENPLAMDPSFRDFSGLIIGGDGPQPRLQLALGSGVIVRSDGAILTNYHVVEGAETISVELVDHRVLDAKVIGLDQPSDLALLKIQARNLAAVTLGDSDRVRVGDVALAIGNPLGIGQTVTAGIISAKGRATGFGDGGFEDFLQTDAPINQGNSGGALVNVDGELIGINSQILSTSGGSMGIGFAIPSNLARNVMDQLVKTGRVRRSRLGVAIQAITADEASSLGLTQGRGVIINAVAPGSPAARAGMRPGDVILAFGNAPVIDANALRNQVANTPPGSAVKFTILRDYQEQEVNVTLGDRAG